MRPRKIPVACIQTEAADRKVFDACWPRALALVDDALARGARLIVLPEGTVPAYVLGSEPLDPEQLELARAALVERARGGGATIVCGFAHVEGERTFNGALVIGPDGRECGRAEKLFLWHFDRRWFAPGRALEPIETPLGTLGVLVCADGRIPTIANALVERGAEMLVMPTAWVTSGRDPSFLENVQADLMINVRARENGVPFAAANKCGVELESVAYCGKSAIVAAGGEFVARAGQDGPAVVFGEVEVGEPCRMHAVTLAFDERSAERLRDPAERLQSRSRARIAFTSATDPREVERFAALALQSDADVLLAFSADATYPGLAIAAVDSAPPIAFAGGLTFGIAGDEILENPAGLVEARLSGVDLFVWNARSAGPEVAAMARTRASELRAYIVVLNAERSFAVDPDGAIVAGTFDEYRLAAFAYDRAKSDATIVAPHTDVLRGLEMVRELRPPTRKDVTHA